MKRFLVVEDEFFIAGHIAWLLEDDGAEVVGPVGSLDEATALARNEQLDGALLDLNIHGGPIDQVATILASRGVPFVFVTAYGPDRLPRDFRQSQIVSKPFADEVLLRVVHELM